VVNGVDGDIGVVIFVVQAVLIFTMGTMQITTGTITQDDLLIA
jgi:hypothetical protein